MSNDLFKGKTTPKNNGEEFNGIWIEGDLIHSKGLCYIHPIANTVKVQNEIGRLIAMHEVIPETVGRYTGLHDIGRNRIFEGDIVKHYNHSNDSSKFDIGYVFWDEEHLCFKRTYNGSSEKEASCYIWMNSKYEVIGNIHDNPELVGYKK